MSQPIVFISHSRIKEGAAARANTAYEYIETLGFEGCGRQPPLACP